MAVIDQYPLSRFEVIKYSGGSAGNMGRDNALVTLVDFGRLAGNRRTGELQRIPLAQPDRHGRGKYRPELSFAWLAAAFVARDVPQYDTFFQIGRIAGQGDNLQR